MLLPVLGSAVAASGKPVSGTALYAATIAFSQFFMTLVKNYILPLTYAYIACGIANAAIGGKVLSRMGKLIKWAIMLALTVLIFIYVGYLTISGAVSGATDAVTVKAAKLTISTVVPVVGGMISDAAETVIAGAAILKNSVGIFGLLAVLAICLVPFLQIGVKYLVYKLTAALSATVGDEQVVGLIETISGAFAIVLGMVGTCALMLFVSLISAVRMVGG
jgi:stage III sporulation protein AE